MADAVTPIYSVNGTYFYGTKRPKPEILLDMAFPRPPWMEQGSVDRTMTAQMYERGISDLGSPGTR